jgi:transcriptional regulator GlxA family with amidase domain
MDEGHPAPERRTEGTREMADQLNGRRVAILATDGSSAESSSSPGKPWTGPAHFVRAIVDSGKPVAAICHGPWNLVEADRVRGRRLTSWPSVRTDLRNAGAEVVDEQVVTDGSITTSRSPDDLPAFCERILQEFAKARQSA